MSIGILGDLGFLWATTDLSRGSVGKYDAKVIQEKEEIVR